MFRCSIKTLLQKNKKNDENFQFKNERNENVKKIEISKFAQRFYAIEILKTIVSLVEKHVKVLLNSEIEICMMTFEILNRFNCSIKSDSKFHVINVIETKIFFEKMYKNAKICLDEIIMRIFIFVINNENHDLIFETFYEKKVMFLSKYFIDDFCEIID